LKTGEQPYFIAIISVISIFNGALVQLVMASRVLYGMSRHGWLPPILSTVNKKTRTPIPSIAVVSVIILLLALLLPLLSLAKLTSFITLIIFTMINLALWSIKRRGDVSPGFHIPLWVPIAGTFFSSLFLFYQAFHF